MLEKIKNDLMQNNVFLTGGAGVGKSFLTLALIDSLKKAGKRVVVLGSTGISSVHIGGQTIHSFFMFGISSTTKELAQIDRRNRKKLEELYESIEHCEYLIIDEISMVSASLMEMIHERLIKGRFGGRVFCVGDFYQLPPIKKDKKENTLFREPLFAFESLAWREFNFKTYILNESKRTNDKKFFSFLEKIRVGIKDEEVLNYLIKLTQNSTVLKKSPTLLFGRNKEANFLNKEELLKLNSPLVKFVAQELFLENSIDLKRYESWKKSLPIELNLELKIGSKVLFCANRWGSYINGEQGEVVEIEDEQIWVEKENELVKVKRHSFSFEEVGVKDGELTSVAYATLEQFPLKLAYAITIHKSQGMSIENLVCDIDNIFENSQFYVAISRAVKPTTLLLKSSKRDLLGHLQRIIRIDDRVEEFYNNLKRN